MTEFHRHLIRLLAAQAARQYLTAKHQQDQAVTSERQNQAVPNRAARR